MRKQHEPIYRCSKHGPSGAEESTRRAPPHRAGAGSYSGCPARVEGSGLERRRVGRISTPAGASAPYWPNARRRLRRGRPPGYLSRLPSLTASRSRPAPMKVTGLATGFRACGALHRRTADAPDRCDECPPQSDAPYEIPARQPVAGTDPSSRMAVARVPVSSQTVLLEGSRAARFAPI